MGVIYYPLYNINSDCYMAHHIAMYNIYIYAICIYIVMYMLCAHLYVYLSSISPVADESTYYSQWIWPK